MNGLLQTAEAEQVEAELHRRAEMKDFIKRHHAYDEVCPEMQDTLARAWARGEARKYIGSALTQPGEL